MYAMHKFRDKPIAAPSPRAFVLTINITMSHTNINPVDVKDKRSSLRLRNKNLESQVLQCASVTKVSSKNVRLNTNCTVVVVDDDDNDDSRPNCETNTISKSLGNDGANSNDIFAKSDALPISQELLPITPNMKSEDHTSKNNTVPIDTKTKDTDVELEVDSMDVDSNSKESLNTAEGSEQSPLDTMKESAIESTNLLNRHPNDKDNSYCSHSSLISNSPMKLDSRIAIRENTPLSSNVVNHLAFAEEEEDEDFELKVDPADAAPRSADITDLVMEGVMFTIRQDRDSVTVMEQKTKLEMDEVLENSEKVENREGEKCLLNSSLLKLENLITKIEMPVSEEQREVGWTGFTQCSPAIRRVDIPSKGTNLPIDYGHNRKHYSTSRMFENMDVDSNKSTTGTSASEESETESTDDGTDDTEIHKDDEHDSITSEEDSVLPSITLNERGIGTAEIIQLKATKKSGHSFLKRSDEFDFSYHNRTASEKIISKSPMINNGMAYTPVANQFFVNSQKNLYTNSFSNRDSQLSDQKPHRLINLITSNENKCLSNKVFSGPRMISNTVLTNEQIPPSLRNVIRKKTEKQEGNKSLSAEMTNTKNSEDTWENSPSSTDNDLSNHKLHSSNVNNAVQRTDKDTEEAMQTSVLEDQLKTTITTPVTDSTTSSRELQIDIEALVNKISGTMHPVNIRTNVNCGKRNTNSLSKRSLRQRECPMKSSRINASDNREFFIDMRKLVQDITRGVKVVVNRIPITDKTVYKKCTSEQKS
ncbi:uncharacterized protein LOC107265758 isoform X2 [Cephus cinctus]|nr:uncharacterized protein LOC107265758 isoform X2 [Cephus cinctus]